MLEERCDRCGKSPVRSLNCRHAGEITLEVNGSRHFCHPERVTNYRLEDLQADEILTRARKPGRIYIVWEESYHKRINLRAFEGERVVDDRRLSLDELRSRGFKRELRYHQGGELPETTLDCVHGWLLPDGRLYPCQSFYSLGYSDHDRVAGLLEPLLSVPDLAEHAMKLQDRMFMEPRNELWRPTAEQLDTIRRYVAKHGIRKPGFMKDFDAEDPPSAALIESMPARSTQGDILRARMMKPLDGD